MENIEMKKNNKYLIGMLMLLPICLLMYTFAYTNEEIRIFYCILEYLGLYDSNKYSTRNTILWVVVIVLLVILLKISFRLTKLKKYRMMEYRFLRTLPYLILCLNIISCFLFPRIERIFLQYQHGLDSIIVPNRGTASLLAYTGRDAAGYNTGPLLALNLESFGSESEDFFVKFIDIEDE